jgi:hypothetical protein
MWSKPLLTQASFYVANKKSYVISTTNPVPLKAIQEPDNNKSF